MLLLLCALTCCWGFANNAILLVFASKVGIPIAVAACAVSNNKKQIISISYYTLALVGIGWLFFHVNPDIAIDNGLVKNFVPSWMDMALAVGLGFALSEFWHHQIRINIVIVSADLASLLPACIMARYHFSHNAEQAGAYSLALYFQYIFGMLFGAIAHATADKLFVKLNTFSYYRLLRVKCLRRKKTARKLNNKVGYRP